MLAHGKLCEGVRLILLRCGASILILLVRWVWAPMLLISQETGKVLCRSVKVFDLTRWL